MIGRLVGRLIRKQPPALLIDVEGVGYELEAPMTAFYSLPDLEQEVIVHTHLVIRDDAHLLFGFTDALQIRLQGVELPAIGEIPVQLIQAIPYVLTVVLLAGFVGKAIAPNAIGQPYIKER